MNDTTTAPSEITSANPRRPARGGRAAPRILAVKYEDCSTTWGDPEFHVIWAPEHEGRRGTHAALPVAGADTIMPADHPVHTTLPGETYQYELEDGGMSPLYEYVGKFTMLKRIRDDEDKQWHIIQEVAA